MAITALALFALLSPVSATVQVPVRVMSWNAEATTETVAVDVPGAANPATWLYCQIHNIRFGGQVSVRVNDGPWTDVYNHTVAVLEPENSQGGIGAINSTIRFTISLDPGQVVAGTQNTVSFRLNGTDGIVSAIRVIDFDFLDSVSARILASGELTQEDPSSWTPPSSLPADIAAGATLWSSAAILNDTINQAPLNANCTSCHFVDGSDLKYFNYSNDSIITRARFHGLTQQQGEQIASYIRSLPKPSPGRPWNPPFQPGANLDPDPADSPAVKTQKAQSWMAGAGIDAVVDNEADILPHIFPDGTSPAAIGKVFEHETTFSVREIPIPVQFPDWNTWLPDIAPEDMWPTAFYYDEPYNIYNTLRSTVDTQGGAALGSTGDLNETFRKFKSDLEDWYGGYRLEDNDLVNDTPVSMARNAPLTREDVIKSLLRWMVVKMMEVTRDYDLEDKSDDVAAMQAKGHSNFTPELLAAPGGENRAIVFGLAPHITGNNFDHFVGQPEPLGKMESNQWYHLQLCMNSGYRMQVNMNAPLDWAYQIIHLESASERAGRFYGMQRLITQIKMLQIRETGKGVMQGGFSQRTLNPCFFYSNPHRDRSLMIGALDKVEPGLWRKVFEEYLYEWLDVMQSHDLSTMPRDDGDRHQLETVTYTPIPWPGGNAKFFDRPGEVHADALYRLLPLLPQEGVDELLLTDLKEWCKLAWPLGNWDSLFTTSNLYAENFEDNASDFTGLTTVTAIKDANYVNTTSNVPLNGGGAYVAERGLTAGALRSGTNSTLSIPLNGATRLKLRARTAFRDNDGSDPGVVSFRMRVQFDGNATIYEAEETITMDSDLYGVEFESYLSHVDVPVGATNLTWLSLTWDRTGGSDGGTVYVDNIHVLPVDETIDTTAPSAPVLTSITTNANLRLRLNWSDTNPAGDGVIGYNAYRWLDGESVATKVKMNTGLIDNPYIQFEDYTVLPEVSYRYHLTAVDAAGNESAPSNDKARNLTDTEAPLIPAPLWANSATDTLDLNWFGRTAWDIAGYDVYRKAAGEPGFTMLTTVAEPAEAIFYMDPTAIGGMNYEYYIEAFDLAGNLSPSSTTLSVLSATSVTHVDVWKLGFNGTNGWDASDPLIAADHVDFDQDGLPTLWEYLQDSNPAVPDTAAFNYIQSTLTDVAGSDYLTASYLRQETLPPGIIIKLQLSNDLNDWSTEFVVEGASPSPGITVSVGSVTEGARTISVHQNLPIGDPGMFQFMRFVIEQAP